MQKLPFNLSQQYVIVLKILIVVNKIFLNKII